MNLSLLCLSVIVFFSLTVFLPASVFSQRNYIVSSFSFKDGSLKDDFANITGFLNGTARIVRDTDVSDVGYRESWCLDMNTDFGYSAFDIPNFPFPQQDFTVSFWLKLAPLDNAATMMTAFTLQFPDVVQYTSSFLNHFLSFGGVDGILTNPTQALVYFRANGRSAQAFPIKENVWTHYTLSWHAARQMLHMTGNGRTFYLESYLNLPVPVPKAPLVMTGYAYSTGRTMRLGNKFEVYPTTVPAVPAFRGKIDDFKVYSKWFTTYEAEALRKAKLFCFNRVDFPCSGRGSCVDYDNCTCNAGYYGQACEEYSCNGISYNSSAVCSGRGSCVAPDTCNCTQYSGSWCQTHTCNGIPFNSPEVCNYMNGTCVENIGDWHRPEYRYRKLVTVNAADGVALGLDYTISVEMDTQTLIAADKMKPDCSDLRIIFVTSGWTELDRDIVKCGNTATIVRFRNQQALAAQQYYVYYGNPLASNPPSEWMKVYLFGDNMENENQRGWDVRFATNFKRYDVELGRFNAIDPKNPKNKAMYRFVNTAESVNVSLTEAIPLCANTINLANVPIAELSFKVKLNVTQFTTSRLTAGPCHLSMFSGCSPNFISLSLHSELSQLGFGMLLSRYFTGLTRRAKLFNLDQFFGDYFVGNIDDCLVVSGTNPSSVTACEANSRGWTVFDRWLHVSLLFDAGNITMSVFEEDDVLGKNLIFRKSSLFTPAIRNFNAVCIAGLGGNYVDDIRISRFIEAPPTYGFSEEQVAPSHYCACSQGWYGASCEVTKCFGLLSNTTSACNGTGTCILPDTCKCQDSWYGEDCKLHKCYGVNFDSPTTCSGNGTCVYADTCVCKFGYGGENCQYFKCNGINANETNLVCNFGNGTCSKPNECSCNSNYAGAFCDVPVCYTVPANNASVCSQHGSCLAPNSCNCTNCYATGNNCEFNFCNLQPITLFESPDNGFTRGTYIVNYNVDLVPSYAEDRIQCRTNNVLLGPATRVAANRFGCSFTNTIGFERKLVSLWYSHPRDGSARMTNEITFDFLDTVDLAYHVSSTIAGYTNQANTVILSTSKAIPNALWSKIKCKQDAAFVTTSFQNDRTISCQLSSSSTGVAQVSLWYNGTPDNLISTVNVTFSFVANATLSFNGSLPNSAEFGSELVVDTLYAGYIPTSLISSLYLQMNGFTSTQCNVIGQVVKCNILSQQIGVEYAVLKANIGGGLNIPISLNTVPIISYSKVSISNIAPFATLVGSTVNVTLSTQDDSANFGDEVIYECDYNSVTKSATQQSARAFTCLNMAFASARASQVTLVLKTKALPQHRIVYSKQTAGFFFNDLVPLNYASPPAVAYSGSSLSQPISVETNADVLIDREIYCRCSNGIDFLASKANMRNLSCTPQVSSFSGNTDVLDCSLWVNATGGHSFFLSSNNASLVLLNANTLVLNANTLILESDANKNVSASFNVPRDGLNLKYSILLEDMAAASKAAKCTFTSAVQPNCDIEEILRSSSSLPMKYKVTLSIASTVGPVLAYLPFRQDYFYNENVTMVSEFPFLVEHNTARNVAFTLDKKVNTGFQYACKVSSTISTQEVAVVSQSASSIVCPVQNSEDLQERNLTVAVLVKDSSYPVVNMQWSANTRRLEVVQLRTNPSSIAFKRPASLVLLKNSTHNLVLPSQYVQNNFSLQVENTIIEYPCDNAVGHASCSKQQDIPRAAVSADIFFATFLLRMNGSTLAKVDQKVLLYNTQPTVRVYPEVMLRNSGNITLEFSDSLLQISLPSSSYQLLCYENQTGSSFSSFRMSNTMQQCGFQYGSGFSSMNSTFINSKLLVYGYGTFTLDEGATEVLLVDRYRFELHSDSNRFFLTSVAENVTLATTVGYPEKLVKHLECRIGSRKLKTWIIASNSSYVELRCEMSSNQNGKANLTVWYSPSARISENNLNEFQISSNAELVVFATQTPITSLEPFASIIGRNTSLKVLTRFAAVDYGEAHYELQVFNSTNSQLVETLPLTLTDGGSTTSFVTQMYSDDPLRAILIMTMQVLGRKLRISSVDISFIFVDGYFLEPSYGTTAGGEVVSMVAGTASNITFYDYPQVVFSCSAATGVDVMCVTPVIPPYIQPFKGYKLVSGNTVLSLEYVLYEKRNVTIWPSVIPTNIPDVNMRMVLDRPVAVEEGSIEFEIIDASADDLLNLLPLDMASDNKTFSLTIPVHPEKAYNASLWYKSSKILAARTSLLMTSHVRVHFLDTSPITYYNSQNIQYVPTGTVTVEWVHHSIIPADVAVGVRCKANAIYLPTVWNAGTNRFDCTLNSSVAAVQEISLWYADASRAYNDGFQLSTNALNFTFIQKVTLQSMQPIAAISASKEITLTMTTSSYSILSGTTLFKCVYGDNERSLLSFDSDTQAKCVISRSTSSSSLLVSIYAILIENGQELLLSTSPLNFQFFNNTPLLSVYPAVYQYSAKNSFAATTATMSLTSALTSTREVYCRMTDQSGYVYSKAEIVAGSQSKSLQCTVSQNLQQTTTVITVDLWVNASSTNSADTFSTSSTILLAFFSDNLSFNYSRSVFHESKAGAPAELSFKVPTMPNLSYKVSMLDKPNNLLLCNFDYNQVTSGRCIVPKPQFSTLPVQVNYLLEIRDSLSNADFRYPVAPSVYIEDETIAKVVPHILSSADMEVGKRVRFNFDKRVNTTYQFYCVLNGGASILAQVSDFYLDCNLVSQASSLNIQLAFNNTLNEGLVTLSKNVAALTVITPKLPTLVVDSKKQGPVVGGTLLAVNNMPALPTGTTGYSYDLRVQWKSKTFKADNCTLVGSTLSCLTPNIGEMLPAPRPVVFNLFIDNVQALPLSPSFTFYESPMLTSILPYSLVPVSVTENLLFEGVGLWASYSIKLKYRILYSSFSQVVTCTFMSSKISCPPPSNVTLNALTATVMTDISLNDENFTPAGFNFTLYVDKDIIVNTISSVMCDPLKSQELYLYGENFVRASTIYVHFIDSAATVRAIAEYINSTTLRLPNTPVYSTSDLVFPRKIKIGVSLGNDTTLLSASTLQVECMAPEPLTIAPSLVGAATRPTFLVHNIPDMTLEVGTSIQFVLENENVAVNLNCVNDGTRSVACVPAVDLPPTVMSLDLRMYQVNAQNIKMRVYSVKSTSMVTLYVKEDVSAGEVSVFPKIALSSTQTVRLSFRTKLQQVSAIYIRFTGSADAILRRSSYQDTVIATRIDDYTLEAPAPSLDPAVRSITLELSYNMIQYETVPVVLKYYSYSITRLKSDLQQDNAVSNLVRTFVNVTGTNFPTDAAAVSNMWIQLAHEPTFSATYRAVDLNVTVWSPEGMSLLMPLLPNSDQIKLPFLTRFGVSFNGGQDYVMGNFDFPYISKFKEPVITTMSAKVLPYFSATNISLTGTYFDIVHSCIFVNVRGSKEFEEFARVPAIRESLTTVTCLHPAIDRSIASSGNVMVLTNLNETSEQTTLTKLTYYEPFSVLSFSPTSGRAQGGYPMTVKTIGLNFRQAEGQPAPPSVYIQFGALYSKTPCEQRGTDEDGITDWVCIVPPQEDGDKPVRLTLNKIQRYPEVQPVMFKAIPCDIGYTSKDGYRSECEPCPVGTYKPIPGFFACIPCGNDTYNPSPSASTCAVCPQDTETIIEGSASPYDCGCSPGFYVNPSVFDPLVKERCLPCPDGGDCRAFNTSIPPAKAGYWHSAQFPYVYLKCFPESACPGGNYSTCAVGYKDRVCGQCADNYFKWRNKCDTCGEGAWWRALLVILLLGLLALCFFGVSSLKVGHMTSISIAFSFWQVISMFLKFDINWPEAVSVSFTAASVTNLNFDFIAPSCIFPQFTNFTYRWALTISIPVIVLLFFSLIYLTAVVRNIIVKRTGPRIPLKYLASIEPSTEKVPKSQKFKHMMKDLPRRIKNMLILSRNMFVWFVKQPLTPRELRRFFNRSVNAYLTFISFSFIFIMTTASEIFVCERQPNGKRTLQSSSDIVCFEDAAWWAMFPFSVLCYLFGLGFIFFFVVVYFSKKKLKASNDFNEQFKFVLRRFKEKYFYWEGVVTIRKLILSILYIFFEPMLVIVFGIATIFIGMLLHMYFVPFKRKFHNLIEYFILVSTLLVLVFGLLFFVKYSQTIPGFQTAAVVICCIITFGSTAVIAGMILWDIQTRRKKDMKKVKRERRLQEEKAKQLPTVSAGNNISLAVSGLAASDVGALEASQQQKAEVEFTVPFFNSDSDFSGEDDKATINEIFEDLFSIRRFRRKVFLVNRKRQRAQSKFKENVEKGKQLVTKLNNNRKSLRRSISARRGSIGISGSPTATSPSPTGLPPGSPAFGSPALSSSTPTSPAPTSPSVFESHRGDSQINLFEQ